MKESALLACLLLSIPSFSAAKGRARRVATPAQKAAAVKSARRASLQAYQSGRRADAPPEAPPSYSKPGALVRTEGSRLPAYADPGNAGTHSIEGGGFVDQEAKHARDVGRAPGVARTVADKPPSVSPDSATSGTAGGTVATANGPR